MINAILRLRRDTYSNYEIVKDRLIPANGEICLVDTENDGLRAVCGDGTSTFAQLPYMNNFLIRGYYYNSVFYTDANHTEALPSSTIKFYVDVLTNQLYHYTGSQYQIIKTELPLATNEVAGAVKLYTTSGNNTDGTMTQQAITELINSKVSVSYDSSAEILIFE